MCVCMPVYILYERVVVNLIELTFGDIILYYLSENFHWNYSWQYFNNPKGFRDVDIR